MGEKYILRDFITFIRPENGFFASGIAISGYLIFNNLGLIVFPLFFAMFFGTGASYAYNYLKDRREDLVNKKKLNRFVLNEVQGKVVVVCLYGLGLFLSLSLSVMSWFTYMFLVALSVLYSGRTRVKEKFLIKNVYTGFVMSMSFVTGATASGLISNLVFSYVIVVFMLGLAANVLGDIRGYEGDRSIGMLTLPILFGFEKTKRVIYLIISFLLTSILFFNQIAFYPVIPFMIAAMFLLSKNKMRGTRMSLLSSFALLPVFLLIFNVMGVTLCVA